jgi:hypothetical protein
MNLKLKYGENYILFAGFRQYIEDEIVQSSVNFYRDSIQNFKEFRVIEKRKEILLEHPKFKESEFLMAFISEEFPYIDEKISENIIPTVLRLIDEKEEKGTVTVFKEFIIFYINCIAKSSKEDYLSFIGLSDSISDEEEHFLMKIKELMKY